MNQAFSSLVSAYKLAIQSGQGTPNVAGMICGRMQQSSLLPAYDLAEAGPEHSCSATGSQRPTTRKSTTRRSSYIMNTSGRSMMYPDLLGVVLRGSGFDCASAGGDHVFTIASENAAWLTAAKIIGNGPEGFERIATDVRMSQVNVSADSSGINYDFTGIGLTEEPGTSTSTNETGIPMLPSEGSISVNIGGVETVDTAFSNSLAIANNLGTDEIALFNFERKSLPQTGVDITGSIGGLAVTFDDYERLHWNGTTSPSAEASEATISYEYMSADGTYSFKVDVPVAEVRMGDFQSDGDSLVRFDLEWLMVDNSSSDPITITLKNGVAGY